MLFILDSTLLNIDPDNLRDCHGLEILLGAYLARNHLLFCDMSDADAILEKLHNVLGRTAKVALTTVRNKSVEYFQVVSKIEFRVNVYIESSERVGIYRNENTWNVPLGKFSDSGLIQSAVLGENDSDAELYLIFAEHYAHKNNFKNCIVAGRAKTGGGSGTPKALAAYLRDEFSPCLCVTDSDKLHPAYKESLTTKNCRAATGIKSRVAYHYSLEEREIENILPVDLIKRVVDSEVFLRDFNERVIDGDALDFWKYIDIKNGVTLQWIRKQDVSTQQYWRKANAYLARAKQACAFCGGNDEDDESLCHCGKVNGLGEKLLVNTIGYLREGKPSINLRLMADDSRWELLGKVTFDFAVAPVLEAFA